MLIAVQGFEPWPIDGLKYRFKDGFESVLQAATPHSLRQASGHRRGPGGSRDAAQGDTIFDILDDGDADADEDDGSDWKASPAALPRHKRPSSYSGGADGRDGDAAPAAKGQDRRRSTRSRSRGSPRGDDARRAEADRCGGSSGHADGRRRICSPAGSRDSRYCHRSSSSLPLSKPLLSS